MAPDDSPRSRDVVTIDLGHLDDDQRWRVWRELDDAGVTHDWDDDGRVTLSLDARMVLDAALDKVSMPTPPEFELDDDTLDVSIAEVAAGPLPTTGARRAGAWLIDAVICIVAINLIPWQVSYGLVALYQLLSVGFGGRTVGKVVTHLRVESVDGGPAGWPAALVRAVVDLAFLWIALFPWPDSARNPVGLVSFVWLIVLATSTFADPLHRGLHDRLAGTVVVRTDLD